LRLRVSNEVSTNRRSTPPSISAAVASAYAAASWSKLTVR
jgi:hypothetical protein